MIRSAPSSRTAISMKPAHGSEPAISRKRFFVDRMMRMPPEIFAKNEPPGRIGNVRAFDLRDLGCEAPAADVAAVDDPVGAEFANRHLDEARARIGTGDLEKEVFRRSDDADAPLPVTARVAAKHADVRMAARELDHVERRRLAGLVSADLEPRVLVDDGLHFRGAADDRIEFGRVATLRDPELDAHHRTVAHAAVELFEAELEVVRIEVDIAVGALPRMTHRFEDRIVV